MESPLVAAYLRWALLRTSLARGWWLCTAVYLVVEAGLTPAQLILIGAFQGLVVVIAEVPAGALADTVSRRHTLVAAHVVMGVGMAMTGFVTHFALLVVSQCLWGLGWALSSGADVAWITDELDRADVIDAVLVTQGRFELMGTAAGIVAFGAFGWAAGLAPAMIVAGATMVLLGLGGVARWPETRVAPHRRTSRSAAIVAVTRRGLTAARGDRIVASTLVATLLVNGGIVAFGRLFERQLIGLGLPKSPAPIVWFAALALVAAIAGALALGRFGARLGGLDMTRRAYVAACAVVAAGLVVFAAAGNVAIAVAGTLLVTGVGLPTIRVASTVLVNQRTPSDVRATVHSLLSQSENLGEIICGLMLAAVAHVSSPAVTIAASAGLLAAAGVVVGRARNLVSAG